jgi:hypothetical protein
MSNSYAVVSALIFPLVAVGHLVRLINRWTVQIGPYNVSRMYRGPPLSFLR